MSNFENLFKKILIERDGQIDQVSDQQAFDKSFDPHGEVGPDDFSTEPLMPGFQSKYMDKAKTWISKLEEMANWLNGLEEDSLNKQFNKLDREGSVFEGISKNSAKLTAIAEDLKGLSEGIKGYVLGAEKKQSTPEGE